MHLPLSQWKSRGEQVGSTGFKRTQMWVRWAGQTRLHCTPASAPRNCSLYSKTAKKQRGKARLWF